MRANAAMLAIIPSPRMQMSAIFVRRGIWSVEMMKNGNNALTQL